MLEGLVFISLPSRYLGLRMRFGDRRACNGCQRQLKRGEERERVGRGGDSDWKNTEVGGVYGSVRGRYRIYGDWIVRWLI